MCFFIGKNCYVGDVAYDYLIKAEEDEVVPETPVYE